MQEEVQCRVKVSVVILQKRVAWNGLAMSPQTLAWYWPVIGQPGIGRYSGQLAWLFRLTYLSALLQRANTRMKRKFILY